MMLPVKLQPLMSNPKQKNASVEKKNEGIGTDQEALFHQTLV